MSQRFTVSPVFTHLLNVFFFEIVQYTTVQPSFCRNWFCFAWFALFLSLFSYIVHAYKCASVNSRLFMWTKSSSKVFSKSHKHWVETDSVSGGRGSLKPFPSHNLAPKPKNILFLIDQNLFQTKSTEVIQNKFSRVANLFQKCTRVATPNPKTAVACPHYAYDLSIKG